MNFLIISHLIGFAVYGVLRFFNATVKIRAYVINKNPLQIVFSL